jgi:hypothetical protein
MPCRHISDRAIRLNPVDRGVRDCGATSRMRRFRMSQNQAPAHKALNIHPTARGPRPIRGVSAAIWQFGNRSEQSARSAGTAHVPDINP